jgi:hypothetical protein
MRLEVVPLTLREAQAFVQQHHRHNKPPHGCKFAVGVRSGADLVGVAVAGRPVARALDDGRTLEVNRSCTDGTPHVNSMLYGAIWRAAKAMGYVRCITYTQAEESGASLRAVGWLRVKELQPRGDWVAGSVKHRHLREPAQKTLHGVRLWLDTETFSADADQPRHVPLRGGLRADGGDLGGTTARCGCWT